MLIAFTLPQIAFASHCSVEAIIRSVVDRIEARAQDAGVHLAVDCAGGEILADASALSEALFNLVANAIEATPRGGSVSLVTRELLNGDQQWVLRDAGHGTCMTIWLDKGFEKVSA